jgi:DNA-binding Lrp family transcriptional regulator
MKLDAIDHALLAALQHDARQRRRNHHSFRTWAASLPDVISVFAMAGRDDYLLHLAVADTNALYTFMVDRITERDDVADFHTSVVYEHIRRPTLSPVEPAAER